MFSFIFPSVLGNVVSLFCIVSMALVSSPYSRPHAKTNSSVAWCCRITCTCLCRVAVMSELSSAALLQFLMALGFLEFHKHTGLVKIWDSEVGDSLWWILWILVWPSEGYLCAGKPSPVLSYHWPDLSLLLISQKCGLAQ